MPYKPTGRRPGRPTKAEAEERRKAAPTTPTAKPRLTSRHDARLARDMEGLSPREALAAAAMLEGCSQAEAGRRSGIHPSSRLLDPGSRVQRVVLRALDRAGATPAKAAARLSEALDAEETKYFPQLAYTDRETGCPVIPSRDVVAHGVRLDAVKEAFKIMGAYSKESKDEADKGAGPVVAINFVARQPASTQPTEQRVTALLDFVPRCSGDSE
jgi:hypothetical protein